MSFSIYLQSRWGGINNGQSLMVTAKSNLGLLVSSTFLTNLLLWDPYLVRGPDEQLLFFLLAKVVCFLPLTLETANVRSTWAYFQELLKFDPLVRWCSYWIFNNCWRFSLKPSNRQPFRFFHLWFMWKTMYHWTAICLWRHTAFIRAPFLGKLVQWHFTHHFLPFWTNSLQLLYRGQLPNITRFPASRGR